MLNDVFLHANFPLKHIINSLQTSLSTLHNPHIRQPKATPRRRKLIQSPHHRRLNAAEILRHLSRFARRAAAKTQLPARIHRQRQRRAKAHIPLVNPIRQTPRRQRRRRPRPVPVALRDLGLRARGHGVEDGRELLPAGGGGDGGADVVDDGGRAVVEAPRGAEREQRGVVLGGGRRVDWAEACGGCEVDDGYADG